MNTREIVDEGQTVMKAVVPFLLVSDLGEYILAMRDCETAAPMLDPTLYQAKAHALEMDRRAAEALQTCIVSLRGIYGVVPGIAEMRSRAASGGA